MGKDSGAGRAAHDEKCGKRTLQHLQPWYRGLNKSASFSNTPFLIF